MSERSDPRILLHSAVLLERAGRAAEAEAVYARMLTRWPNFPDAWYNLALLQRRAGRFDAALASYQQALERGVSQPEEVHLNRGVIYSDCLRDDAAAERELQAALALNPSYVPALLNLANLKEDLGQRDQAHALYERILTIEPDCCEALARYAGLKTVVIADDPLIGRLKGVLVRKSVRAADKAHVGFALGRLLDACGAYEEAFDAYSAANLASRESAAPQRSLYDRRKHELFIDEIIAAFPAAHPPATAPLQSTRPIFICGMFRSGSTLTEQVLAGHSLVAAGGELPFVPSIVRTELAPFPESMKRIAPAQLGLLGARYLQMVARLFPCAAHVTDKRPDNFLYIGLIKALIPQARIIHTKRCALDNCLSIHFLHLDHSMGYALDLLDTAHYYVQQERLMSHWRSLYGRDIFEFDYDAFVREPLPVVRNALAFCGLEWEDNCLNFQQARTAVKTASVWQVREALYRRSSGRWRNYASRLTALRDYLEDLVPGLSECD